MLGLLSSAVFCCWPVRCRPLARSPCWCSSARRWCTSTCLRWAWGACHLQRMNCIVVVALPLAMAHATAAGFTCALTRPGGPQPLRWHACSPPRTAACSAHMFTRIVQLADDCGWPAGWLTVARPASLCRSSSSSTTCRPWPSASPSACAAPAVRRWCFSACFSAPMCKRCTCATVASLGVVVAPFERPIRQPIGCCSAISERVASRGAAPLIRVTPLALSSVAALASVHDRLPGRQALISTNTACGQLPLQAMATTHVCCPRAPSTAAC